MANPQDNETKNTPSTAGSATKSGSAETKAAQPIPSGGHNPMNRDNVTARTASQSGINAGVPQLLSNQNVGKDQPLSEKVSDTASGIIDKAKETASGTYNAVSAKATEKIEEHKGELSSGLKTLADSVRKTGSELESSPQTTALTDAAARYTGTAARQIENVANYFERKDLRAMMQDAENFARRNPAIFLGAAFGLGILAARFLKSSSPDRRSSMQSTAIPSALPSSGRTEAGIPRTNP